MISFKEKLHNTIKAKNSNLCVGIDIDKKYFHSDDPTEELKDYSKSKKKSSNSRGKKKPHRGQNGDLKDFYGLKN